MWFNEKKLITLGDYSLHKQNLEILNSDTLLTVDDVLLQPAKGRLASRSEAVIGSPYIYTAPMDTVTDIPTYASFVENRKAIPVLSRVYLRGFLPAIKAAYNLGETRFVQRALWNGYVSCGTSLEDIEAVSEILSYLRDISSEGSFCKCNIAVDVAHGYSEKAIDLYKLLASDAHVNNLMSGSICTAEAAEELIKLGVNVLRVGIGGGQMCTTRLMTGCGVPNLSAIFEIFSSTNMNSFVYLNDSGNSVVSQRVHIIADGGIRYPGDGVKYMAAGATGFMVGTAFASCVNSPALKVPDEVHGFVAKHRGQASLSYQLDTIGKLRNGCAEGVSRDLPMSNLTMSEKADEFDGGLRSAISYLGLTELGELNPLNVKFLKVSPSTYRESRPID